ncbi:3-deoxy-D-manno-octulosonic acid kinase [Arenimonas fontis]|uniref:3-deoxy-D-manno-octulosonic acid kinase n=1 Tax=Arenimonas fontis TaxID=2608255 RepID=A0A5B2ZBZ5_9GAMM|nr:3-deoxy-D-manno-octulosonic acid kinase [Arenimonas fontis]KAA2285646.1 3-deoxy-D-manno-octulosonic acid kinase [Arenimonas fontis]
MENSAAVVERLQPVRDVRGSGAIVFDPARLRQASAEMLEPAYWGGAATPVASGGRGAAWFVRGDFGEAVLRHYRRGGLAARLSERSYLWLGQSRVRALREFRLLGRLREQGLPAPAPLLAGWWRRGLGHRMAILVERIPGARSLASWLPGDVSAAPWETVGAMLARFHRAGLEHADLNAHNILLDGDGQAWLIDFDRGRLRVPAAGWQQGNLARLQRSLAKLSGDADWQSGYVRLHAAYARAMEQAA